MRAFAILLAMLAGMAGAQDYNKGTASTQQTIVGFGAPVGSQGDTLLVLNASYKRDSAGSWVTVDTASLRPYAGALGACSNPVAIEAPSNVVQPTSRCELSYFIRASDTAQGAIQFRAYTRYLTPTGANTSWRRGQSLWDSLPVILTHTPPRYENTTGFGWGHQFGLSGGEAKICVQRTNVGSGDTVYVTKPILRCW
jgi:hypothetical protein